VITAKNDIAKQKRLLADEATKLELKKEVVRKLDLIKADTAALGESISALSKIERYAEVEWRNIV